ncbi:MAG: DUF1736 domain-containing protein, partial [bacterium]
GRNGGRGQAPPLRVYSSMLAAAGIYFILRRRALGTLEPPAWTEYDNIAGAAPAIDRILTATAALGRHLGLLVWPARLSADYSYHQIPLVTSPAEPAVGLTALAAAGVAAYAWRRRRDRPEAGLGLLLFAITYAPVSNFLFPIGTLVAERLLYVPSIGFCLFTVAVGRALAELHRRGPTFRAARRFGRLCRAASRRVGADGGPQHGLAKRFDSVPFRRPDHAPLLAGARELRRGDHGREVSSRG